MPAPLLALLAVLAQAQEPAPAKAEPGITLSGGGDLRFYTRDGDIERSRLFLGSAVPDGRRDDDAFFAGRQSLRADLRVDPATRAVLEIATLPYFEGENRPFGGDPVRIRLEQAHLSLADLGVSGVTVRFGVQEAKLTLRPHAEPFFLDASRSESFYSGLDATGAGPFVAMTADRTVGQVAGLRIEADPADYLTVHLFSGIASESFTSSKDETLTYIYGNLWIPEQLSAFALAAIVVGPGGDSEIWTWGAGADYYPEAGLEFFGEGYLQGGRLGAGVDKDAWAAQLGARLWSGTSFVEAAVAHRSGDGTPGDGTDRAFQSYENVNQFLIVESAEVGLDLDTNLRSFRLAAGIQGLDLGGRFTDLALRLDAGLFHLDEGLSGGGFDGEDRVGTEIDLSCAWIAGPHVTIDLKGALLVGPDVMSALAEQNTAGLDRGEVTSAAALVAGASVRF